MLPPGPICERLRRTQVDVSAADLSGDFLGIARGRNELWFRYRFRGLLCGHGESRRSPEPAIKV
jgi:hypothetical protein